MEGTGRPGQPLTEMEGVGFGVESGTLRGSGLAILSPDACKRDLQVQVQVRD